MSRIFASILLLAVVCVPSEADETVSDQEVVDAVARSLDFIQTGGVDWIEQRECVTCHQVPFMVWSLNRAAEHGLPIDAAQLSEWNHWAQNWRHFAAPDNRDEAEKEDQLARNIDVLYQLLLGRSSESQPKSWSTSFINALAATQQDDGTWKPGGQLPGQKRPKPETQDATTMWTLYTLVSTQPEDVWRPLLDRAEPVLNRTTDAVSTEWWAVRLLLMNELKEESAAATSRSELLRHQQDDGGWGWLLDEPSDAFGTGMALYALSRTATHADDAATVRGRSYLMQTQAQDGSWPVHGTKQAKRDRVEETATYWGTCWAVIGLLETLGS